MTKGYHKEMPLEQGAAREKDWTLPATFVLQVQDLLTVMKEGLLAVGAMAALHIAEQIMEAEVEEKWVKSHFPCKNSPTLAGRG